MARRRRPPRPGALADLSPTRIATQILILQLIYYSTALVLITFSALAAGKTMSADLVLRWQVLRGDVTEGWMFGLVWMLVSLVCVIPLLLLIARSKLIPDFALTIHFLHLLASTFYSGSIPRNLFWWALQAASSALMTSLGIWSCRWRELQPIQFGGHADVNGGSGAGGQAGGDAEAGSVAGGGASRGDGIIGGLLNGRVWGRGKDGGGVYELISKG